MAALAKYQEIFNTKVTHLGPDVQDQDIPIPTKGWNSIQPLARMEAEYAVVLDNWIPRSGYIELRGGYNAYCQSLVADTPVQSLMVYRSVAGTQKMFAACGTIIFDVSSNGTPTEAVTGITGESRFNYENFTPAGNVTYLVMCNGTDPTYNYNGTTWSTPSITGVSSSTFTHVHSHMRRLWFVQANTTKVWYLGTDAISGAATALDVGSFMSEGGYVVATATWTVDGGNGPRALLVIITSRGQLIIYQGSDPAAADTWTLVGVFDGDPPIGNRCLTQTGSDVLIITNNGLIPLSKSLPFNPASDRSVALTSNIQPTMLAAARQGIDQFGWEVCFYPLQSLMVFNVPVSENVQQYQYVMNTINQSWCRFTGWNANTFDIYDNDLYFGDNNGNVNIAYTGSMDLIDPIVADMKFAFNFFGQRGRVKTMSMVRPYLIADGTITPTLGVDVDFSDVSPTATVTTLTPSGGVWDTAIWDESTWSSGSAPVNNWLSTNALGTALALRMKVNFGGTTSASTGLGVFDVGVFDSAVFDGSGSTLGGTDIPTLQVTNVTSLLQFGGLI